MPGGHKRLLSASRWNHKLCPQSQRQALRHFALLSRQATSQLSRRLGRILEICLVLSTQALHPPWSRVSGFTTQGLEWDEGNMWLWCPAHVLETKKHIPVYLTVKPFLRHGVFGTLSATLEFLLCVRTSQAFKDQFSHYRHVHFCLLRKQQRAGERELWLVSIVKKELLNKNK